jgi:capsular exopolysaccharide synthesis family protein
VTLVDGDLRRSRVARLLGVSAGAGLSDVLAGRAELGDVLQRTRQSSNLLVLAAGTVPPNPSEVLGSARMKTLLRDLAGSSIVIVDSPPLLPVTDGAVLAHQADGALLVVSHGKTNYDLVEKSLDTLRKARGRALGIVLNKVPLRGADSTPYSKYEYRQKSPAVEAPLPHPPQPIPFADDPQMLSDLDTLVSTPNTEALPPAEQKQDNVRRRRRN